MGPGDDSDVEGKDGTTPSKREQALPESEVPACRGSEPCRTCGKPLNDMVAMAECLRKWVPPGFHRMLNESRRGR